MKKNKNTLLWRISKPGLELESYIFGTIHIWNDEIEKILLSVLPYLRSCSVFAAESDINELENISRDFLLLKEDQQLKDLFKPGKFKKLSAQLKKKFGISIEDVQQMSPFALYTTLGKNFLETGHSSLDEKLWDIALSEGKPTTGIESAAEQLAYYTEIPLRIQSDMLYQLVMQSANFRRKFSRMVIDYLEMDIAALYKSSKKGNKFIRKVLVYRRNDLMSARIAETANRMSVFTALGAGHLAGKKGILKQLKDSGFIIKPINIKINDNKSLV